MKLQATCLLLLTVLLAGCWQKSVHPFYTEKDLIEEPKLAGAWILQTDSDDDRTSCTITAAGDKRYAVAVQNKEGRWEYEARLFKLDGERFLNLESKLRSESTVPAHHAFRIVELGEQLKFAPLYSHVVRGRLRKNPGALAHAVVSDPAERGNGAKDEWVLTADTKALQKFLREHMNDKDLFLDSLVLKK